MSTKLKPTQQLSQMVISSCIQDYHKVICNNLVSNGFVCVGKRLQLFLIVPYYHFHKGLVVNHICLSSEDNFLGKDIRQACRCI